MSNPPERRIHPRHSTELTLHATPEEGGLVARMVAENLSLGGLYCTSSSDLPEMTRVAVRLLLPDRRSERGATSPLDVDAVVVRREPLPPSASGEPRFKLALFFTRLEDSARDQLTRYLGTRPTSKVQTLNER